MAFLKSLLYRRKKSLSDLTTIELFDEWKEKLRLATKKAKYEDECMECVVQIKFRYDSVLTPILKLLENSLDQKHEHDKKEILAELQSTFGEALTSFDTETTAAELVPSLIWRYLEDRFDHIMAFWNIEAKDDFRRLKPRFMTRLFVDELNSHERKILVDNFYLSRNSRSERTQPEEIFRALEALHRKFKAFEERIEDLSGGVITTSLIKEVEASRRYGLYIKRLRLIGG